MCLKFIEVNFKSIVGIMAYCNDDRVYMSTRKRYGINMHSYYSVLRQDNDLPLWQPYDS